MQRGVVKEAGDMGKARELLGEKLGCSRPCDQCVEIPEKCAGNPRKFAGITPILKEKREP
jgi:hypothetical protein